MCVVWHGSPAQCWHERLCNQEAALVSEVQQDVLTAGEVIWQGSCPLLHPLRVRGVTKAIKVQAGTKRAMHQLPQARARPGKVACCFCCQHLAQQELGTGIRVKTLQELQER